MSLSISAGRTLCIAGESDSGKSVTALSIMGLLPESATVKAQRLRLLRHDLMRCSGAERRALRGRAIGMIFQEPMTALNPVQTIGAQIAEVFAIHRSAAKVEARARALAMLARVQIPDAARRFNDHPHQLSGGMKQRVMIAMALVHHPSVLLAD